MFALLDHLAASNQEVVLSMPVSLFVGRFQRCGQIPKEAIQQTDPQTQIPKEALQQTDPQTQTRKEAIQKGKPRTQKQREKQEVQTSPWLYPP